MKFRVVTFVVAACCLAACGKQEVTSTTTAGAAAASTQLSALLDPNTADATALGAVPGMTANAIQSVITKRPFTTPSQLHAVLKDSVAAADLPRIYDMMFVKVNLNTASEEDLKLIPSSLKPGKLAHEFEEYRPYKNMDQFRREIGKYVDEQELAPLERYVTLD